MFRKITAIDKVALVDKAKEKLNDYAHEVVFFDDSPQTEEEIIRRIGDSDVVLVSYVTKVTASVIAACPSIKYIGMCCSLYSEESANVDIAFARTRGIPVYGIRDYGDRGVVEYVIHELTEILHGFYSEPFFELPTEIYGLNVGFVGFGTSGQMTARSLRMLGANISYYCRGPKENAEKEGMHFKDLKTLLRESQTVICCLNKNVILLKKSEFESLGNKKILINTSIGPGFDSRELERWLENSDNIFCCDTKAAAGDVDPEFFEKVNVRCPQMSSGMTAQAYDLLSEKVLANLEKAKEQLCM